MTEEGYKQIFARNLNYFLKLNNKNQMDLIKDLDLSSSTVSNWATGLKLPRMNSIQMLADYFGVEKSDLLEEKRGEEDIIKTDDPSEKRLLRRYRNVTKDPKDREKLEKFLDSAFEFFENDEDE